MPVRYDIASQIPQASAEPDIMNMMAQYQAMGYRQQQNMLAQLQMQELQRKLSGATSIQELAARPGFNIMDPNLPAQVFRYDPQEALRIVTSQRQADALRASQRQAEATAAYHTGTLGLATQKYQNIEVPESAARIGEIGAKTSKEKLATAGEELKNVSEKGRAVRELLRPVYMARDPAIAAERYADVYSQIKQLDPNIARRLGPQFDSQVVKDYIVSPEEFVQSRRPISGMKHDDMIVTPTGRPNEPPIAVQPKYVPPNALATEQPGLNALAAQGKMPPGMEVYESILNRQKNREAAAEQFAPGPNRDQFIASMDFTDTLNDMGEGFTDLASSGGMTQRGASTGKNLKSLFRTSSVGSWIGKMSDSEVNAKMGALRSQAQTLLQQYKNATGLNSRQMDAVKEVERIDSALANPDRIKGLSEAYAILDALNKRFGSGGPVSRGQPPAGKPSAPAGKPSDELDSILSGKRK